MRPKYPSRPEVPAGLFALHAPEPSQVRAIDASAPMSRLGHAGHAGHLPPEPPPMEVIELEVDPDPSIPPPPVSGPPLEDTFPEGAPEPLESRSRLVSAPPVALELPEPLEQLEPLDVGDEPPGHVASDPTIEVAATEVSNAELEALEADRAPTSSRRPITMEEKMNELDDDVVPLHTAPPESGRLPAASPTFELAFEVRPELPAEGDVAVFVAPPPRGATARTFGELLDDALSL